MQLTKQQKLFPFDNGLVYMLAWQGFLATVATPIPCMQYFEENRANLQVFLECPNIVKEHWLVCYFSGRS